MNRVLLLYPPSPRISRGGLAIPMLSSYLKSKSIDVTVLDCPGLFLSIHELMEKIGELGPDIIGISVGATEHLQDSIVTMTEIRRNFPGKLIVCGGVHVTLSPEDVVEHCDLVCLFEGQETLEAIVRLYPDIDAVRGIDGICYAQDGKTVFTKERDTDISRFPAPDWGCIPIEKYLFEIRFGDPSSRGLPTIYSMACPNQCTFCPGKRLYRGKLKYRDADIVLDEIQSNMEKYGVKCFFFCDPCFTANPGRAKEFCERVLERGLKFEWFANCTINTASDELLELMAKAGCVSIGLGIESCNDHILKRIKKSYQNVDKIRHVLDACKRHGLFTAIGIIIGFVDDTIDSVWETVAKSAELNISSLGVSLLTPYPGCEDYDRAMKEGNFICKDFANLTVFSVSYIPEGLKDYDLWKCRCFALYYFYSRNRDRVSYWLNRFKDQPGFEDIVRGWLEIYEHRDELDYDYFMDFAILEKSRRRKADRRFYEPFLPDFSKAHKTHYCRMAPQQEKSLF